MCTTRRDFIGNAALSSVGLAVAPLFHVERVLASGPATLPTPGATGERIAAQATWIYRIYSSKSSGRPDVTTWAQIDLGSSQAIDAVELYPSNRLYSPGDGFPVRFCIECSESEGFSARQLLADESKSDYPDPHDHIIQFRGRKVRGRYIRLTVTRLRRKKSLVFTPDVPQAQDAEATASQSAYYLFALAKMSVLSEGVDIAVNRHVTVDDMYGDASDAQQLTRPARPQGEGIVTDYLRNVTEPETWQPVTYRARAPLAGVKLSDHLFKTAMQDNIQYLLESFSVDDLLRPFRERAGKSVPALTRKPDPFWEEELAGSNAGRFLMGAANTLHSIEDAELRKRMNAVVEGIAECRQPNGYIMGYKEDTFFSSERAAYTRSWLTHGLIEAGYAGNEKAFLLLRGYYDWYNRFSGLPQALRAAGQGGQGMVANTRLYFTPVGKAADIQVIQRYFQENYWLDDLTARRADAIWQYPYDHPHCYLLTNLEAYLDLYRATGDKRYLIAVLGGWELYRENWQNVGGVISIIEVTVCPPKSNALYELLGENCGGAFWVLLNHRLHLLNPEDERYVAEIEKSLYNVLLANQSHSQGIRYHAILVGEKEKPTRVNTCCEGQGTRLLASLPRYIYSTADDGVYVNLFESSTIEWQQNGQTLRLEMETTFPCSPDVRLRMQAAEPVKAKIRLRTPSWAQGAMSIEVNGVSIAQGMPGSYVTLDRKWSAGDVVSFVLPLGFRLTKYEGVDQIKGRERYALEYGPILMAALNGADAKIAIVSDKGPVDLPAQLKPVPERPLHFRLSTDDSNTEFIPYFEIEQESFSCFPVIEATATKTLYY